MAGRQTLVIQLPGDAPYGFRLIGGNSCPLIISKIRPFSKAQQSGLLEGDVVLAINNVSTQGLTHATATGLTESDAQRLAMHILRGRSTLADVEEAQSELAGEIRTLTDSEAAAIISASANAPRIPNSSESYLDRSRHLSINGEEDEGTSFVLQMPPSGGLKQMRNYRSSTEGAEFGGGPAVGQGQVPSIQVSSVSDETGNGDYFFGDHGHDSVGFASSDSSKKPGFYSRQEHTFNEGDTTRKTVEEVTKEKIGNTTVTKVVKHEITNRQTTIPVQFGDQSTTFTSSPHHYEESTTRTNNHTADHMPIKVSWEGPGASHSEQTRQIVTRGNFNRSDIAMNDPVSLNSGPVRVQAFNKQTNAWETPDGGLGQRHTTSTSTTQQQWSGSSKTTPSWDQQISYTVEPHSSWKTGGNKTWIPTADDNKFDFKLGPGAGAAEIQIQFQPNVNGGSNTTGSRGASFESATFQQPKIEIHRYQPGDDFNEVPQRYGPNNTSNYPYESSISQPQPCTEQNSRSTASVTKQPGFRIQSMSDDVPHVQFRITEPTRSNDSQHSYSVTQVHGKQQMFDPSFSSDTQQNFNRPYETDIYQISQTQKFGSTRDTDLGTDGSREYGPVTVRSGAEFSSVSGNKGNLLNKTWGQETSCSGGENGFVGTTRTDVQSQHSHPHNVAYGRPATAPVSEKGFWSYGAKQAVGGQQPYQPQSVPAPSAVQYPWKEQQQDDSVHKNYNDSTNVVDRFPPSPPQRSFSVNSEQNTCHDKPDCEQDDMYGRHQSYYGANESYEDEGQHYPAVVGQVRYPSNQSFGSLNTSNVYQGKSGGQFGQQGYEGKSPQAQQISPYSANSSGAVEGGYKSQFNAGNQTNYQIKSLSQQEMYTPSNLETYQSPSFNYNYQSPQCVSDTISSPIRTFSQPQQSSYAADGRNASSKNIWQPSNVHSYNSIQQQQQQQQPQQQYDRYVQAYNGDDDSQQYGGSSFVPQAPPGPPPPPAPPLPMGGMFPQMAPSQSTSPAADRSKIYGPRAVTEGVKIASSMAHSVMSPENSRSRGQNMFLKRRAAAAKWTTSGGGGGDGDYETDYATGSTDTNVWSPTTIMTSSQRAPNYQQQQSQTPQPQFQSNQPIRGSLERNVSFTGARSPSLPGMGMHADDMSAQNMGKGGQLFAKRKERAERWNAADAANQNPGRPPTIVRCSSTSGQPAYQSSAPYGSSQRPPTSIKVASTGYTDL